MCQYMLTARFSYSRVKTTIGSAYRAFYYSITKVNQLNLMYERWINSKDNMKIGGNQKSITEMNYKTIFTILALYYKHIFLHLVGTARNSDHAKHH
jgi:hypothetical protein